MANDVFLFLGAYPDESDAQHDYEAVKRLHSADRIGTYDAAVVTKQADGWVNVQKDEIPMRHGAWTGLAAGAVVGILFPPALIPMAAARAGSGAVIGQLWHGLSRSDVRELGDALDTGPAALIVIGDERLAEHLPRDTQAIRYVEKQARADGDQLAGELSAAQQRVAPAGRAS
jgi:uncharacterized membrane protein